MMAELTGMDISNASMYDGSTATAEAVLMAKASTKKTDKVLVSSTIDPKILNVVRTYAHFHGIEIKMISQKDGVTDKADMDAFLAGFRSMEILTPAWKQRLANPAPRPLQKADRAMLRYLISRYWLQAISDFDIVCRAKLAVSLVLLNCLLGGDSVATAQLLSKEIENDAANMDALLDGSYTLPGLTDANLLALIQLVTKHS